MFVFQWLTDAVCMTVRLYILYTGGSCRFICSLKKLETLERWFKIYDLLLKLGNREYFFTKTCVRKIR